MVRSFRNENVLMLGERINTLIVKGVQLGGEFKKRGTSKNKQANKLNH